MSREPKWPRSGQLSHFVFNVRNVPAALYKALGGFATRRQHDKLEATWSAAFRRDQFYADVEPSRRPAAETGARELAFFSTEVRILASTGTPSRIAAAKRNGEPDALVPAAS